MPHYPISPSPSLHLPTPRPAESPSCICEYLQRHLQARAGTTKIFTNQGLIPVFFLPLRRGGGGEYSPGTSQAPPHWPQPEAHATSCLSNINTSCLRSPDNLITCLTCSPQDQGQKNLINGFPFSTKLPGCPRRPGPCCPGRAPPGTTAPCCRQE